MHEMNETAGRSSDHEPRPAAVDSIFCRIKGQRVDTLTAQAAYQAHHDECISCRECQPVSSKQ